MNYTNEELDKIYKVGTEIFCTGFGDIFPPCLGAITQVVVLGSGRHRYILKWENDGHRDFSGETDTTIVCEEMIVITNEKQKLGLILKYGL